MFSKKLKNLMTIALADKKACDDLERAIPNRKISKRTKQFLTAAVTDEQIAEQIADCIDRNRRLSKEAKTRLSIAMADADPALIKELDDLIYD